MTKDKFECTCESCKNACTYKPGWFMPNEAERAAEHLNFLSLQDFFDQRLSIDWWAGSDPIFIIAPALIGEQAGSEYPGDPHGECVFFNSEGLCDIHLVKPFECAELCCDDQDIGNRHEQVSLAWKGNQKQIVDLLGREPETKEYGGIFSSLFSSI